MRYLGEVETRQHNKTHTGYKVFNFRINEYELDTIAYLIDISKLNKQPVSEQGRELQKRIRGLRKGILQLKRDVEEEK